LYSDTPSSVEEKGETSGRKSPLLDEYGSTGRIHVGQKKVQEKKTPEKTLTRGQKSGGDKTENKE